MFVTSGALMMIIQRLPNGTGKRDQINTYLQERFAFNVSPSKHISVVFVQGTLATGTTHVPFVAQTPGTPPAASRTCTIQLKRNAPHLR
jgi:hypothetical protein